MVNLTTKLLRRKKMMKLLIMLLHTIIPYDGMMIDHPYVMHQSLYVSETQQELCKQYHPCSFQSLLVVNPAKRKIEATIKCAEHDDVAVVRLLSFEWAYVFVETKGGDKVYECKTTKWKQLPKSTKITRPYNNLK
jgi:hypothetical protein